MAYRILVTDKLADEGLLKSWLYMLRSSEVHHKSLKTDSVSILGNDTELNRAEPTKTIFNRPLEFLQ